MVWLDALITNVDRTPRNPNLLCWHGQMWLIDHGAALYRQHAEDDFVATARQPFPLIEQHVLLPVRRVARRGPRPPRVEGGPSMSSTSCPDEWLIGPLAGRRYKRWLEARA